MRILIIADIHANLTALEAVLTHAQGTFDMVWCLGDLVGYGPEPNACVQRIRALDKLVCLSGNHDRAAIGKMDLNTFNPVAATALRWTQMALLSESRDYLNKLPSMQVINGTMIAHGSPRQPYFEYISDTALARKMFGHFTGAICLIGHTHIACVFQQSGNRCHKLIAPTGKSFSINTGRYILNPGAVGQPRDHNPQAAYAILDLSTDSWVQQRVPYNITETQRRMRRYELPETLITRLDLGV